MTILYEKIGRRYHPVKTDDWHQEIRSMDFAGPGCILVTVNGACTSYLHRVNPDYAAVLAALKLARNACQEAMHKAAEFKPKVTTLSKRHQNAYARYQAAIPKAERQALWAGSIQDGLDAMEKVLMDRIARP